MHSGAVGVLPSWCSGQAVMVCPSPPRSAAGGGSLTSPEARHGQCRGSPGYRQVHVCPRSQRSAEWIMWMRSVIETVALHAQPQTGAHCYIFQKRNVIIGNYNLPGLSVKEGGGRLGLCVRRVRAPARQIPLQLPLHRRRPGPWVRATRPKFSICRMKPSGCRGTASTPSGLMRCPRPRERQSAPKALQRRGDRSNGSGAGLGPR